MLYSELLRHAGPSGASTTFATFKEHDSPTPRKERQSILSKLRELCNHRLGSSGNILEKRTCASLMADVLISTKRTDGKLHVLLKFDATPKKALRDFGVNQRK